MSDESTEARPAESVRLARQTVPLLRQTTGKLYLDLERELSSLSPGALRDLARFCREAQSAIQSEKNKRRRGQFWG